MVDLFIKLYQFLKLTHGLNVNTTNLVVDVFFLYFPFTILGFFTIVQVSKQGELSCKKLYKL